jgi:glycosyltransferase involved in cell wall biosynthesis
MTAVVVIVPTRDNLNELQRCLASLTAQSRRPDRVIVCVDGSTDGTLDFLRRAGEEGLLPVRVRTHPGDAHRGRAATRNLGLDGLEDDLIWFVDSDMIMDREALARHIDALERDACASVGLVVYSNASESAWAGYLSTRGRQRYPDGAYIPFTQFTTANSLVKAEHVRALGGFDERFTGYGGEDLDFAYRLQGLSAQPLVNNRQAVARTVETKTVEEALAEFERYGATNLRLMEQLHPEMPRTFKLERMTSRRMADRMFAATVNSASDRFGSLLVRRAPKAIRNRTLNYMVVSAIWRGYRSAAPSP